MKKENIFNDGQPGIVDVIISEICKPKDDYREIRFKDNEGRILKHRYYYLDENDPDFEKKLKAQGIRLKHLWKTINGDEKIPEFSSPQVMLDTVLNEVFISSVGRNFRIAVDYGLPPKQSKYLRLKKFVPFIEEAIVEKTGLYLDAKAFKEPSSE